MHVYLIQILIQLNGCMKGELMSHTGWRDVRGGKVRASLLNKLKAISTGKCNNSDSMKLNKRRN